MAAAAARDHDIDDALRVAFLGLSRRGLVLLALLPAVVVGLLTTVGPLQMDPVAAWGGVGVGHRPGWLPGFVTIDPNMGTTSFALGVRAALDLMSGRLPLWNHYEGFGAPLLGEMQSAALFPPTLLLLLPHGQAIEQALLQAVAGLGTYLFLRRFGLGRSAALVGGLLFEFNGVFAWLRNAVYNPVAFLPWLMFTVESLFRVAREERAGSERWWTVCLGAIAGALALYAGFPEVVYFYAMLVAGWVVVRGASLPWRRATGFGVDLAAVAVLAVAMAAPVLIGFGQFLREAAVGGHHGVEFRDHFLPPYAFLAALLPYVFGPINAATQAGLAAFWGDIGGYVGVMPLLLAVGGAVCAWRSATSWLLVGWIVLAVGASHGVPVLHGVLTALPLVTIAAYCRYLDAGWIFACVVLAAVFVDRLQNGAPRRAGLVAGGVVLALLAVGVWFARSALAEAWQGAGWQGWAVVLALTTGVAAVGGFVVAMRSRRAQSVVAGLAVGEAVLWFMVPFASTPGFTGVDRALIEFLRGHTGVQRFAIESGTGLAPNFGSVFGIPSMNYDDLPVPARTATYVTSRLDATNDGVIFGHNGAVPPAEQAARQARFVAALPGYAAAGVRYVLSTGDMNLAPAYGFVPGNPTVAALGAGEALTAEFEGAAAARIGAVSVLVGTYDGKADGGLRVRLCQEARCATGAAPLATAPDNRGLLISLEEPFALAAGVPTRLSITKEGGGQNVALWLRPVSTSRSLPVVDWVEAGEPRPILRTARTTVYELAGARPYADAPGCRVTVRSQDSIETDCAAPSRLLRLEVFMQGWTARVGGAVAPIVAVEDTFQGVEVPAGASVVTFSYAPGGVREAMPVALGTLAVCLGVLGRAFWRQRGCRGGRRR